MMYRANDRQSIHLPGQMRYVFADLDAGDGAGDGLELAAHLRRSLRLGVPGVEMADAAPTIQDDASPRPSKAAADRRAFRRATAQREIIRQRQTQQADPATAQKTTACKRIVIAVRKSRTIHDGTPQAGGWGLGCGGRSCRQLLN
jgi:hypothetical protein